MKALFEYFVEFLNDFNTTSGRIVCSLFLSTITIVFVLLMMLFEKPITLDIVIAIFSFISVLGGLDVIQYTQKRKTFRPQTASTETPTDTIASISINRDLGNEHGVEITE